ncbi:hypothetical protein [uncultured Acinetobacter sp.]|uniref:hypothetical protein n=1 Tax=uncultured Acinetobacter sp. TaxID=165433 RepID=UPI0025905476|nr:hypothetical protein [uncultured Acinetobacter sp.]
MGTIIGIFVDSLNDVQKKYLARIDNQGDHNFLVATLDFDHALRFDTIESAKSNVSSSMIVFYKIDKMGQLLQL